MLSKKVEDLKVEDIQTKNEALFNEIFQSGVSSVTINTEIETRANKAESQLKILRQGIKLGQVDLAESLIANDKPELEAMTEILTVASDNVAKIQKEKLETFNKSIPAAAGAGDASDANEIDTKEKAVEKIVSEKKCSRAAAISLARREYPELFTSSIIQNFNKESK